MFQQPHEISFKLPFWIDDYCQSYTAQGLLEQRMAFVIEAARRNIKEATGGPFAAAIFERDSGKLVSLGVNLVTTEGSSILHAEMVAIAVAQQKLGSYDLGRSDLPAHELITSAEPCAMCFGAIPWSGVRHVAAGAIDSDVREIGFDEGPKPSDWAEALRGREIEVSPEVNREQAREVLQLYAQQCGHIYNSRED